MGKSQRTKGHGWERQICKDLREAFPHWADQIKRGWQTAKGSNAPDVEGLPGFWIEAKVGARPNILAAMDQASEACHAGSRPIVVSKQDRRDPMVTMYWEDFIDLMREYYYFKVQ